MRQCEWDDLQQQTKKQLITTISESWAREAEQRDKATERAQWADKQVADLRVSLGTVSKASDGFMKQAHALQIEVDELKQWRKKDGIVMQALAHALLGGVRP